MATSTLPIAIAFLTLAPAAAAAQPAEPAPEGTPTEAVPVEPPETTVDKEAGAEAVDATTVAGVNVSGSVDTYFSINPARGVNNDTPNGLYAFELAPNQFAFSYAELALERAADPVGFRLDLGFGPTVTLFNATDIAIAGGYDFMEHIEQAYVAWQASPKLLVRLGKMVTHHGMEVIESQNNWNYTHSLLFTWAIPFTHTGLMLTYASPKADVTLYLANGLNNTFETNQFKMPGFQVLLRPNETLSLIVNYCAFNELLGAAGEYFDFGDATHLFDVVALFKANDQLELAANADLSHDGSVDQNSTSFGLAGYARYHVSDKSNFALRAEYLKDGGTLFGLPDPEDATQDLGSVFEVTGTLSHSPAAGLLLRADARFDQGLGDYEPFTDNDSAPSSSQFTLTLGAVAMFP